MNHLSLITPIEVQSGSKFEYHLSKVILVFDFEINPEYCNALQTILAKARLKGGPGTKVIHIFADGFTLVFIRFGSYPQIKDPLLFRYRNKNGMGILPLIYPAKDPLWNKVTKHFNINLDDDLSERKRKDPKSESLSNQKSKNSTNSVQIQNNENYTNSINLKTLINDLNCEETQEDVSRELTMDELEASQKKDILLCLPQCPSNPVPRKNLDLSYRDGEYFLEKHPDMLLRDNMKDFTEAFLKSKRTPISAMVLVSGTLNRFSEELNKFLSARCIDLLNNPDCTFLSIEAAENWTQEYLLIRDKGIEADGLEILQEAIDMKRLKFKDGDLRLKRNFNIIVITFRVYKFLTFRDQKIVYFTPTSKFVQDLYYSRRHY